MNYRMAVPLYHAVRTNNNQKTYEKIMQINVSKQKTPTNSNKLIMFAFMRQPDFEHFTNEI